MARTEFHRKLAEQIEAIKSVAQANQRVAEVLGERAHLAKFVIDLVKGISCFRSQYKDCEGIAFNDLDSSAKLAYTELGFQTRDGIEDDLITLCSLTVADYGNCTDSNFKATSKPGPADSPTATPPPRKRAGK